jgi:voltage-gated potassium channel
MARDEAPFPEAASISDKPRRVAKSRAVNRFMTDPSSTRNAVILIVVGNLTAVLIGGLIVWLVDRREYEALTEALWYTLQTITTVGYGDVTPTDPSGRLVGAVIMLLGIASLSILTATITSSFIDARQAERQADEADQERATADRLDARLEEVIERLDRLERLARPAGDSESA